jgi:hypothetical protein
VVRFNAADEAEVANYLAGTGEPDSAVLARAVVRGIRVERLERAMLRYATDHDMDAAARVANLPRAVFMEELLTHGITVLDGEPDDLLSDLEQLQEHIADTGAREAVAHALDRSRAAT